MSWRRPASRLWAFSFGLIRGHLTPLDPWGVACVRLALASAVFLPFALLRAPRRSLRGRAMLLGVVQFGAMYALYIASFRHLAAWQVALWTILTPLYVALLNDMRRRRLVPRTLLAAALAVAGAAVVQGRVPAGGAVTGVLLVQASNLCFAIGQLGYRPLAAVAGTSGRGGAAREAGLLGWMYLGAVVLVMMGTVAFADRSALGVPAGTGPVLLYLGLLPTAAGFWLWNSGAARTSAGLLAVANNLKVPLAVLVAWLVFGETAPYLRAVGGLAVIVAALVLAGRRPAQ